MPLTPADVHNVAFSKPPIGKRGYNEDEVDQFLDLVEDTLAQLIDDNEKLRAGAGAGAGVDATKSQDSDAKVDEAELRREVEAKLRGEYEAKLADAKRSTEKAEAEARTAKADAEEARKAAEEAQRASSQQSKTPAAAAPAASPAPAAAASGAANADTHMQAAKVLGLAQEMADRLTHGRLKILRRLKR